jgi:hypothetical protein
MNAAQKHNAKMLSIAATALVAWIVIMAWSLRSIDEDARRCREAKGRVLDYRCYDANSLREIHP